MVIDPYRTTDFAAASSGFSRRFCSEIWWWSLKSSSFDQLKRSPEHYGAGYTSVDGLLWLGLTGICDVFRQFNIEKSIIASSEMGAKLEEGQNVAGKTPCGFMEIITNSERLTWNHNERHPRCLDRDRWMKKVETSPPTAPSPVSSMSRAHIHGILPLFRLVSLAYLMRIYHHLSNFI